MTNKKLTRVQKINIIREIFFNRDSTQLCNLHLYLDYESWMRGFLEDKDLYQVFDAYTNGKDNLVKEYNEIIKEQKCVEYVY